MFISQFTLKNSQYYMDKVLDFVLDDSKSWYFTFLQQSLKLYKTDYCGININPSPSSNRRPFHYTVSADRLTLN